MTSLERALFPDGTTKADLIRYYREVAPVILPHIAERPMTLWRAPEGTWTAGWFQTICRSHPGWLPTQEVRFDVGTTHRFCVLNEEAAIVWAVNLGTVELHPLLATRPRLDRPLAAVFDLDPGRDATMRECCAAALLVRERLDAHGIVAFPKVSGGGGVHLYVPTNATAIFDETRALVRGVAADLARDCPDLVVDRSDRSLRRGRVFVDWAQNHRSRSTIAPYSIAGRADEPRVSMPVPWDAIERGAAGEVAPLRVSPEEALARLERDGDLFAPTLTTTQPIAATTEGNERRHGD